MEGKNSIWMIAAIGLISVFLFAAFASAENSARVGRLAAAQGGQPNSGSGQAYDARQQALAAPSANPLQALLPSKSGGSCGGGGGGCGCGGGGGNQPAVVPAADSNVKPTGVTKRISLGVVGSSYDPAVITVNKGDTLVLEGDMTRLLGCDRSFVIPGYGIRKTFKSGDNVLQFVADKAGTFPFSCSMGMYRGTLVVQ